MEEKLTKFVFPRSAVNLQNVVIFNDAFVDVKIEATLRVEAEIDRNKKKSGLNQMIKLKNVDFF